MDRITSTLLLLVYSHDTQDMRLHDLRKVEHEAIMNQEYTQRTIYQVLWNNNAHQEESQEHGSFYESS